MVRLLPVLLLFVVVRLAQLGADPPHKYPTGQSAIELVREGTAKAHEARRYGLFGSYVTNSADNYRVWNIQSPIYVKPLSLYFQLVGVGRAELRVFCTLAGAIGLIALFLVARNHSSRIVPVVACASVAVSFFDIQLTRGGLLETYLNAVLAVTIAIGIAAQRELRLLVLCHVGFVAALLTKQTALFAFPLLVGLSIGAHRAAWKRAVSHREHLLVIAAACLLCAFAVDYIRDPSYWKTVEWNASHVLRGQDNGRSVTIALLRIDDVAQRLIDSKRWFDLFMMAPLAPLALIQLGVMAYRYTRRKTCELVDVVAATWLLSALSVLQLSIHVTPRFSIILLPPVALLAASFIACVLEEVRQRQARIALWASVAAMVAATDIRWQAMTIGSATYDLDHANKLVSRALVSSSVVVGSSAAFLAFDSPADLFYVKGPFNTDRSKFQSLGATHLLVHREDGVARYASQNFGAWYRQRERVLRFHALGEHYTLFRMPPLDKSPEYQVD